MATTVPESATPSTGARRTSILARFTGENVTPEQYDETMRRLEQSGDLPADGLDYHVAFTSGGKFRVSEIWDSREQFEAFGKRLMPLLGDVGITLAGEPEVIETYNVVKR
jgi:hypothetical protein